MPGTPIAKSHSFSSVNCFTCFGFINCSASVLRSSGLSGGKSSGCRSPFSRTVGGRPTLRCRSDAFSWTSCCSTVLKLNAPGAPGTPAVDASIAGVAVDGLVGLAIGIDPEEHLPVLDGLRVLDETLLHHARNFRLDRVHDLHR